MKPAPFTYTRPTSWPEALKLLRDGARPAAGTQSLGPLLNLRLAQPGTLIDLRHLPDYVGVTPGEGAAEATLARIKARLAEAARTAAPIELQFGIADPWSRQLFLALARR